MGFRSKVDFLPSTAIFLSFCLQLVQSPVGMRRSDVSIFSITCSSSLCLTTSERHSIRSFSPVFLKHVIHTHFRAASCSILASLKIYVLDVHNYLSVTFAFASVHEHFLDTISFFIFSSLGLSVRRFFLLSD